MRLLAIVAENSLNVRRRFFESGKREFVNGRWAFGIDGGTIFGQGIIKQSNIACRYGNIDVDYAHCKLIGGNHEFISEEKFEDIYGISIHDYEPLVNTSNNLSQVHNLRATMLRYFWRRITHTIQKLTYCSRAISKNSWKNAPA